MSNLNDEKIIIVYKIFKFYKHVLLNFIICILINSMEFLII